ncbi:MAG TPA: metallophosphoesterase family protein [Kofleriaceae bacterium]|nr:metallophosphoesterase family protein [Kofleriaceae bacterium]
MLKFSRDPNVAEQQMRAIIFYLTAFGYIDGQFDLSEKTFIRHYIRSLVEGRANEAMPVADSAVRADVVKRFVTHFHEVFEEIDRDVRALFTEVVAPGEKLEEFVLAKLKLRGYEIFRSFDLANQQAMLETIDELIRADGKVHPEEAAFRDDLRVLLEQAAGDDPHSLLPSQPPSLSLEIEATAQVKPREEDHPFFAGSEQHYSADPVRIRKQAETDYQLIVSTMRKFDEQRGAGKGKLTGARAVDVFAGQAPFLDQHVYVHPLDESTEYEVTVLGDLHGCYSCLKAALMQADFFAKVEAWRLDRRRPHPKLVFLGDYIDRGRFSYNGVLRTVMQMFLSVPEHVYVLRGNHEYYIEYNGRIYGGVRPAEAINSMAGYMPNEMFEAYMKLFESMPSMLLFGRVLFVHAGIPRDATVREKWTDLSTLNDPELRFQMLWSDPSEADFIPENLQAQNARFPFGRLQFERFMAEIGCTMMVRGHEKILSGFSTSYEGSPARLLNLFSAGGANNADLPPDSSYREVTPMALTMRLTGDGNVKVTPWLIEYERYNDPRRNAFFARPPEIEHRAE